MTTLQCNIDVGNEYRNQRHMQFGFRKNHSTEMATCYLIEKIKTNIDRNAVGAVFFGPEQSI